MELSENTGESVMWEGLKREGKAGEKGAGGLLSSPKMERSHDKLAMLLRI